MKILVVVATLAASTFSAFAAVPNTFQSGQPARAADVNENFQSLDQRIKALQDEGITLDRFTATDGNLGVAAQTCPSSTSIVSVACDCSDSNRTRNFGHLFSCSIAGNGGIAGCQSDAAVFNPTKPFPLATVVIECLGVTTNFAEKSLVPKVSTTKADFDRIVESMRQAVTDRDEILRGMQK